MLNNTGGMPVPRKTERAARACRAGGYTRAMSNDQPIIVVGRGHSGTRLFAVAVQSLGVRLGAEAHMTGDLQERWFTRRIKKIAGNAIPRIPDEAVPMLERSRFKRACQKLVNIMSPDGALWGWKFPETYLIPWHVQSIFPRARWLEIIRDGRDLAFKEHLTDNPAKSLGKALLMHIGAMGDPHHVQAAKSWAYQVERFARFSACYPRRVYTIRFEDLLSEPQKTMDGVASFLGVPMTDACRELLESTVDKGKKRQHREERAEEVREVEAAIGPTLERLGYLDSTSNALDSELSQSVS